jgi:hypothetical protein
LKQERNSLTIRFFEKVPENVLLSKFGNQRVWEGSSLNVGDDGLSDLSFEKGSELLSDGLYEALYTFYSGVRKFSNDR